MLATTARPPHAMPGPPPRMTWVEVNGKWFVLFHFMEDLPWKTGNARREKTSPNALPSLCHPKGILAPSPSELVPCKPTSAQDEGGRVFVSKFKETAQNYSRLVGTRKKHVADAPDELQWYNKMLLRCSAQMMRSKRSPVAGFGYGNNKESRCTILTFRTFELG